VQSASAATKQEIYAMKYTFRRWTHAVLGLACAAFATGGLAETLKIAFIDPFSGPYGVVPENALRSFRISEDFASQEDGENLKLEFVPFDNKISAQESLLQLKNAIDQGYRYIMQGVTSGVTAALVEAVEKHNQRNPGKEVVLLNWLSTDPDLTNKGCSFWHFRFFANSDMLAQGLVSVMAKDKSVKKVYMMNSSTSSGRQVSEGMRKSIQKQRPDIEIVGDDFYPLGQVKDFAPYVPKIKASGADTVFAGQGSVEVGLFMRSVRDASLQVRIYSLYANGAGAAAAIGDAGVDRLKLITFWNPNADNFAGVRYFETQRKQHDDDYIVIMTQYVVKALRQAAKATGSIDPVKVAFAMEGMKFNTLAGPIEIRKSDHQAQIPLYVGSWGKVDGKIIRYDQEKTGYGWKPEVKIEPAEASLPTTCAMKRPAL
jgi:branched-chain amino acid transport system substrate-binding protein